MSNNLTFLKSLNLADNNIFQITGNDFGSLQFLNLSNNFII